MFDLRYHVASLAAVFLALIIGILVGAGLAARTDVEGSERAVLEERIAELQRNNADLSAEAEILRSQREASAEYIQETYDLVINGRLRGVRVAMLFIGQPDDGVLQAVEQTLEDASAAGLVEMEALQVPIEARVVLDALPEEQRTLGLDEVGTRLGEELVRGGETPFWDALIPVIVQENRGSPSAAADAVVVAHTAVATDAPTRQFLDGLYAGMNQGSAPVVGIERLEERPSRVAVFKANGLSSVDAVDTELGKVALAGLLAGGPPGHYGLKRTADDGPLPLLDPLQLAPLPGG